MLGKSLMLRVETTIAELDGVSRMIGLGDDSSSTMGKINHTLSN
jgi:hypothetical protein